MNPLLIEYKKRRNSKGVKKAREAYDLLWACIHEAGHWAMLAHFNVMLISASVDRRYFIGSGEVVPGFYEHIPNHKVTEVKYSVLLAGIYAVAELTPFITTQENLSTSKNDDIKDAGKLLDEILEKNSVARTLFIGKNNLLIRQRTHQNWSMIEALAFELMKHGRLGWSACRKVEIRYGIGYSATSAAKQHSALGKLSAFHSSSAPLLTALIAMS